MYELKKNCKVTDVKICWDRALVLWKIYRAAVSQSLRNIGLKDMLHASISLAIIPNPNKNYHTGPCI